MPTTATYELLGFIIDQIQKAEKALDKIDTENPVEEHLERAYAELEDAAKVARNLQKNISYEDEED